MQHRTTGAAVTALTLGTLAFFGARHANADALIVRQAKARFAEVHRSGTSRHMVKLTMHVDPAFLPELHVGAQHPLRVTLDGVALCDADLSNHGYSTGRRSRWRYRGEIAGGRVKFKANGRSGTVKVTVTRAHLADLRDSAAADLPLTLELAGSALETSASFRVVERRVRMWRGLVTSFPPGTGPGPGPGPDPDPGPVDPPPSTDLRAAILADLKARGIEFFVSGTRTPGGGFDGQRLLCPSGNPAEVVGLSTSSTGSVDRFSDTAYVCRDSNQYWARRTGGFAGVLLWVGPFPLP